MDKTNQSFLIYMFLMPKKIEMCFQIVRVANLKKKLTNKKVEYVKTTIWWKVSRDLIFIYASCQILVFCWNNCSGHSQEKYFKCNLVFPKLSRLKKGQRVKGFWSQGRKKGTKGKVFEAEAVGRGWEMFPRFLFFYRGFKMFTSCPSFFNQDAFE